MNGMRPVVDLNFVDFAFGAMDEIVNQAAKMRYMWGTPVPLIDPCVVRRRARAAQHNNSLEAWFMHTPGLRRRDAVQPRGHQGHPQVGAARPGPRHLLHAQAAAGTRGEVGGPRGPGAVRTRHRPSPAGHVTLVSAGTWGVQKALKAADALAADGIEAEVIDLRTIFPLNMDLIADSVRRTRHLVVVTESQRHGGIGAEIAAALTGSG